MSGRDGIRLAWLLAATLVAIAAGCDDGHDHDHGGGADHGDEAGHDHGDGAEHGHDHGEEGPTASVTRWSDRYELFAEHPVAVVDETVGFLAHLTRLEDFSPLTDGEVTLVLEGPQRIRAEAKTPLRPGIYYPRFVPRTPGTYEASVEIHRGDEVDTIDGFQIEVHADAEAAAVATGEDESADTIDFLKEQQWRVPFDTAFATRDTLVPTIEVPGEVTTPPGGSALVGAPVSGRLVAPRSGLPRPGQEVRRGALLASISPTPAAPEAGARAELAVAEAEARLSGARSDLERAERLHPDQAISDRALEQARREVEVAEQALAAARRAKSMFEGAASGRGQGHGQWRLTAPIDGVVAEVHATPGETVGPGDVLFRIIDPAELWIRARVPEHDAGRIRRNADAAFRIAGLDTWMPIDISNAHDADEDEGATDTLVDVGRTVHPTARTVDVLYSLRDPDARLRVGGSVRVAIPVGEATEAIVIPRAAVVDDDGRSVVYVQRSGEAFEERTVRLGARAGNRVAVERGVEPGTRIVIEGANLIRLSARAPAGAGHGHVH